MGKLRIFTLIIVLFALVCLVSGVGHSMSYFAPKKAVPVEAEKPLPQKEEVKMEAESDKTEEEDPLGEEDGLFMGDRAEEEVDLEAETPEALAAKNKLFIPTTDALGAKPLKLTLEDCIRIALVNNNKVQASEYSIDAARAKYEEAMARFYPVFEYEWMSAPVPKDVSRAIDSFFSGQLAWWNKAKFTMGIPLYSFGKFVILKDLAEGGITAARENRKKERLSTVTRVRQLYYGVLLAEEVGRLLRNAHTKLSKEMEKRRESGGSPIDRIKAKVFLVDLEKKLADARDKELLAIEGLRVQLGLNPDVAVMVYSNNLRPIKTTLRPEKTYIETAQLNRPDVKLVEVGLETRRRQYDLEKRKFLPDIGFGAYAEVAGTVGKVTGITTTDDYSDPLDYSRAGFGMRVQGKLDIHGQMARVKKAKSDYYQASLEHFMAKDGITLDIKKAYMDAVTSLDNVHRANRAQKYARQLMFLTKSNYEIGIGEEDEYTEALKLVLLTRGRYFEAIFNYNVALAILDDKVGIIPEIGIGKYKEDE